MPPSAEPEPTELPGLSLPQDGPVEPRQALELVPAEAEVVTVTDWDNLRARFGAVDLTSDSLMTDRLAFRERVRRDAVLLAEGLLREEESTLALDHGFGQDDVAWEVRFTGPDGPGYVVAFRPEQDMAEVRGAVAAGVGGLAGAAVLPEQRLVVSGTAADGEDTWAMEEQWRGLVDDAAESTYLRRGCLPVNAALGPDADVEDQQPVAGLVDALDPLAGFSVTYTGGLMTAWLGPDREDLHERADLSEAWPQEVGFDRAFDGHQVADPLTGRIGLRVADPQLAAGLTLTGSLPFAVCPEMDPLPSPTPAP